MPSYNNNNKHSLSCVTFHCNAEEVLGSLFHHCIYSVLVNGKCNGATLGGERIIVYRPKSDKSYASEREREREKG